MISATRSRTGPGRPSNSAAAAAKKQPPRKTSPRTYSSQISHSLQRRAMPLLGLEGRADDLADEDVARGLDRGELQLLLRAEVREQPALAHREFRGEPTDGQPFEPLRRGDVDRDFKNGLARAVAVRLAGFGGGPDRCLTRVWFFNGSGHFSGQYSTNVRFQVGFLFVRKIFTTDRDSPPDVCRRCACVPASRRA